MKAKKDLRLVHWPGISLKKVYLGVKGEKMWSRNILERQCHDLKPGSQNVLCDLLARSSNSIHPVS